MAIFKFAMVGSSHEHLRNHMLLQLAGCDTSSSQAAAVVNNRDSRTLDRLVVASVGFRLLYFSLTEWGLFLAIEAVLVACRTRPVNSSC